jgi:hypothetical protein
MSAVKHGWARLTAIVHRDVLDREFDAEAQSHIDLAVDDCVRRGMPAREARRLAHLKFGGLDAARQQHRDARGLAWLDGFLYDLRFPVRALRRDRMFTLAATALLTLAIALNVTVFTIKEAMLVRGNPLAHESDRLVYIGSSRDGRWACRSPPSRPGAPRPRRSRPWHTRAAGAR